MAQDSRGGCIWQCWEIHEVLEQETVGSGNGALGSIVALSPGLAWGVEGTTQLLSLPGSEDAEWQMGDWLLGVAPRDSCSELRVTAWLGDPGP